MKRVEKTLYPKSPFSLNLTAGYQTYFQGRVGADSFESGIYRRLLDQNERMLLVSVSQKGTLDRPKLNLTIQSSELYSHDIEHAERLVKHILAIDIDLQPFYKKAYKDRVLTPIIQALRGLHPPRMSSVFEGMIFAISGQQVSSLVARKIRTHIVDRFGHSLFTDEGVFFSFPAPKRLLDEGRESLLEVKLSGRKAEYILGIATEADRGTLDAKKMEDHSDEEIIALLDGLRGVGRWTAEWILLRALGRPDIFPAGDLALRRIISNRYLSNKPLDEPEARKWSEQWSPYRTFLTTYLFAAATLRM